MTTSTTLERRARRPADAAARAWPRLQVLAASSRVQTVTALLLYGAFAAFLTWPVLTHLDTTIYISPVRPEGDYSSIIAQYRELAEGWHNPFLPGRIEDFNAPYGQPILWVNNVAAFPSTLILYGMTAVFGGTAAFSLFAIGGLVASAIAMFGLVRRYTGSAGIALVIGFAYGFYPYVIANGEHPHHMHGWVFVLMLWRLLALLEQPTVRNGIWAGLATVVAIAWTPYFLLTAGVVYATVTAAALVVTGLRRAIRVQIVPQLVCLGIVLAYLVAVRALVAVGSDAVALGGSTLIDIVAQTARPAQYLFPSGRNPIVGDLTRPYLEARGWFDNAEKSLYVGISIALLALVAGVAALRGRLDPRARARVLIAAAVVLVALAFSAPPRVAIGDHILSLPSYYMWQIEPGWRIYTRFVMVVMLGLCVAAAYGLYVLRRGRSPRVAAAILAAAAIVIPLDLWSKFEPNTRALAAPPIYETLRAQPPGILAEYPIQPSGYAENYDEMYNQQFHDKPILNGWQPYSDDEAEAIDLHNLGDHRTPVRLYERGVRYVLLKHRPYPYSPAPGRPRPGSYTLIERSAYGDLYRVRRPQAQPEAK